MFNKLFRSGKGIVAMSDEIDSFLVGANIPKLYIVLASVLSIL